MTRFRFTFMCVVFAATILAAAHSAGATTVSSVGTSYAGVAAATSKPRASVKLSRCVGSPEIDARKIVFTARTWIYSAGATSQKRQMRFDLYRRYNEQKKFRRVRADGLSTWTTEEPTAVIDERELSLDGLETAAKYFVKVSFRWYDASGETIVEKRRVKSRVCALKDRLPDPMPLSYVKTPVLGSDLGDYHLPIRNRGGSEAAFLPVVISVDGGPATKGTLPSLLKGDTETLNIRAPWCSSTVSVKFDPARTQRIAPRARRVFTFPC